jgi:uroporphyrinogen-III synthase
MNVAADGARMPTQANSDKQDLHGRSVVITRPAGTAAALSRRVRALGGVPILLPGMSLRGVDDEGRARTALEAALGDELIIFTSPAGVRYALALEPLRTTACVLAVGQGTARALRRRGAGTVLTPQRQDSEGLLAHAALQDVRDRKIALIGAPGGRGLLRERLIARGAQLREVHVYRRGPARLDRRHVERVQALPASALVLWSSAEALSCLHERLPPSAWAALSAATAVVSSERLAVAAGSAGFYRIVQAASALSADLLQAAASAD